MTEHDELLAELGEALQVEPSPEFVPGIRARVDLSRRRARWMWWSAAAACATVAAVIALRPPTAPIATPQVAEVAAAPSAIVAQLPPAAPTLIAAPIQPRAASRTKAVVVSVARVEPAEPRLEVITNQGAVLRALWQGRVVGTGAPVAEAAAANATELTVKPIAVEPIAVPLVVVNEIVIRR